MRTFPNPRSGNPQAGLGQLFNMSTMRAFPPSGSCKGKLRSMWCGRFGALINQRAGRAERREKLLVASDLLRSIGGKV